MSMAIKYAMSKKAKKMASGGCVGADCPGCSMCEGTKMMAEGGEATHDDDDIVGRILMKRLAKSGNEPTADFEPNDFDVMDQIPEEHDADYTGANSGDELGNEALDEEDHDLVARIMKSRAKKDRLPRPA